MTASEHLQGLLDLGLADLTGVRAATLARHASALPHEPSTTLDRKSVV